MKLASYQDGSRDGQLVVVSRDLTQAHYATGIADRLQQVLDDWNFLAPQLQDLYAGLNAGRAPHAFSFDAQRCMAPLPRPRQWLGALAYPSHVQRVHGEGVLPPGGLLAPLYQGGGERLLGAHEALAVPNARAEPDLGAQLAVVTGEVPQGASPEQALASVRLLVLANAVVLRSLWRREAERGLGPLQALPAIAFGPVAVTPDELGEAWHQGRVHLTLQVDCNGRRIGRCEAGSDMGWHFGELLAQAVATRGAGAGTLLGSGPVSNADPAKGCSCLAERRALEVLDGASGPRTPLLGEGDRVRIEMKLRSGQSVFGAIDQVVVFQS